MELKQLRSFATVVESRSFTKAAEKLYTSQPTISTHIRQLEEQLHSRLIVRTTKSIEVTPRGWELYECAATILKLQDDLLQRWSGESRQIIRLGASTIPSAYLLPELLTAYGKAHPGVYFSIHQSDSRGIVDGLLNCSFDVGLIGMKCTDEALSCIPFYQDRMVLIAPVNEHFLRLKERREIALEELPAEKRSVPEADFGEDEGEYPVETYLREEMPVSAPQFFIGAKLRPAARGEGALRQRLAALLAMRLLTGGSSPFYARLYAQGLLNRDFDYEVDFSAGTATVIIGGESAEPERVLEEFKQEVARIGRDGFDGAAFERAKRASLGARLRGLEDFDNVCVSLAEGTFDGFCALDSVALLEQVTKRECEEFVTEKLAPERLAISIIAPGKE